MSLRVRGGLLLACLLWAVSFLATRVALATTPPLLVVTLRLLLSALCFALFFGWRAIRAPGKHVLPFGKADIGILLVLSLLGTGLHYGVQTLGLQTTTASNGSVWASSGPVTILLISVLFGGERLDPRKIAGIALALLGSLVVLGLDTLQDFSLSGHLGGDLLVMVSIVLWGGFTVYGRRFSSERGALQTLGVTTIIGALWMTPVGLGEMLWRDFSLLDISAAAWGSIAFLGIGCSFLATLLYFRALERSSAQEVGVWLYAIAPLTFLAAGLLLHEPIGWNLLLGSALVLIGVRMTDSASSARSTKR